MILKLWLLKEDTKTTYRHAHKNCYSMIVCYYIATPFIFLKPHIGALQNKTTGILTCNVASLF